MTDEVAAALERARVLVEPAPEERAALENVTDELVERAQRAIATLPVDAEVLRVGSTARDTWLPGDRDIDLFVRFPTELDRDELREHGLAVGHAVLPEGYEEYAEHPYVTGTVDGFDVDVVPCYDVDSAAEIRSAVDRTPFHTEYVREHLDERLPTEVRLAKGFCTGVGVYGSDLRTQGFGGYLLELLVIEHGSFRALLEAVTTWTPPVEFDPKDHGRGSFDDSLVVVDPTDPDRNVAAVVSEDNLARLQHHTRAFLSDPDPTIFEPDGFEPLDEGALCEHLGRRKTIPVAVRFAAPDLVDDDLYPQLRTSLRGIVGELDRRGFDVLRSRVAVATNGRQIRNADADTDEHPDAILFAELAVAERPAIERHEGPPVHVEKHAAEFYAKYADDPDVYGPFIEGDRYVVERPREFRTASEWLQSEALFDVKHGVDVEAALQKGYDVLAGENLVDLLPEFAVALREYFEPRP